MVDLWSREPLYEQLAGVLRAKINSGEFPPGSKLASELTLQQTYGLARGTVRAALDLLRDEGLVVTFTGRGTFVRPDPKEGAS